jgi:hypothetical protein
MHVVEELRRWIKRFEVNCRAIGGIPVKIHTHEGLLPVCHSKSGGALVVPT